MSVLLKSLFPHKHPPLQSQEKQPFPLKTYHLVFKLPFIWLGKRQGSQSGNFITQPVLDRENIRGVQMLSPAFLEQ